MLHRARDRGTHLLCAFVWAGLMTAAGSYAQADITSNCPGDSPIYPSRPKYSIAPQASEVTEGEHAVFILTRRGMPGPCQKVRVRISGHDKIMAASTRRLDVIEVVFGPGATTRTLRLPTQQDSRNEGDGEIRATIVRSSPHTYTVAHPNRVVVRVRDDDIPEVTLHAVWPADLTLEGDTWVGDISEGTKVRFETRCSGDHAYSHPTSFLPLLDHAHDFNHPIHTSYNVAGYALTPCNREHEFPIAAGQTYTGPGGGEIRAHLLSSSEIESRWVNGRVQHDGGGLFYYFGCSENDFSYCPRYTVGAPNAMSLDVRNLNPTVTVAAAADQVEEGEPARFVITRHWDHPGLFDTVLPGDPYANTRIGFLVSQAGAYVADEESGEMQRDAFTLTVHEYTVEIPTGDDAMRRYDGTVTLELLPDSFPDVNAAGQYELYESIPGITPPGKSSIRATVTIRDNDPDPVVSIGDMGSGDGNETIEFTVILNDGSDRTATVDWTITDGTGPPGGAPVASGSLTLAPGETTTTIIVPIDSTLFPPGSIFTITLSDPVNAVFADGTPTVEAQLTIQEEERPVVPPTGPTVVAVPDTAGNLMVTWEAATGRGTERLRRDLPGSRGRGLGVDPHGRSGHGAADPVPGGGRRVRGAGAALLPRHGGPGGRFAPGLVRVGVWPHRDAPAGERAGGDARSWR